MCWPAMQESVFELGERVGVLSQVAQPALVPHMAEAAGQKLPYEVSTVLNVFEQRVDCDMLWYKSCLAQSCRGLWRTRL
jgi:hypothetical protein